MLQSIRNNVQGLIAKAIIALIVIPFAFFGVETLIGGGGPSPVAKVNGVKISEAQLLQAVSERKRQLLGMMGDHVQPDQLDDAKLRGPALEGLITQQLLLQSADALGLRVSDAVLDQTIASIPAFQEDGKFSVQRYQTLLRNQGMSPAYFKEQLRHQMLFSQLQSGIADTDFATANELGATIGLLHQQRSFAYATLPVDPIAATEKVSDADIEQYYKQHTAQYLRPERVKLDYIELNLADFAKPVTDAQLQAAYDKFKAGFKPTTQRHAAHILIAITEKRDAAAALKRAEQVEKKLAAGASFASLAKRYSDDTGSKDDGGDVGTSSGDSFLPDFEAALAQLNVGQVSKPVETAAGYEIIKLLGTHTDKVPTFAEKKAELRTQLGVKDARPQLLELVEKLRDQVFNADGLDGPAKQDKLTVRHSDWVERGSADPLFGNAKVQAAAFSSEVLKDGNNSDVMELAPNHYIVLRVDAHQDATPRPLDEVRDQVATALKHQQAVDFARRQAEQLVAAVHKGGDFDKLAREAGFEVKSVATATRDSQAADREIVADVFELSHPRDGVPVTAVRTLADGKVAVLQLQSVQPGRPDSVDAAGRKALAQQLAEADGQAVFVAYLDSLKRAAKIEHLEN